MTLLLVLVAGGAAGLVAYGQGVRRERARHAFYAEASAPPSPERGGGVRLNKLRITR